MASILDKTIWQNAQGQPQSPYVVPSNQNLNGYSQKTQQANNSGQNFAQTLYNRRANSAQFDPTQQSQNTQDVAASVANKSAGYIPTNQYGLVTDTKTPTPDALNNTFNQSDQSINQIGTTALNTANIEQQQAAIKRMQDLQNSFNIQAGGAADLSGLPTKTGIGGPGYTGTGDSSVGGRAVALALQAYRNGTPYVWGGNSLTKGIDCSGLVQQVYAQLGINLPRTTYEQAKAGKIINIKSLMPGDLVFYNTGSSDPNGIGTYGHVAIYMGNGQVVNARNTRMGMRVQSLYDMGNPALGVRPW